MVPFWDMVFHSSMFIDRYWFLGSTSMRAYSMARGVSEKMCRRSLSEVVKTEGFQWPEWSGFIPEIKTVMWRCSSLPMASLRTMAPVASIAVTRDMRKMTTLTSETSPIRAGSVGGGEEQGAVDAVGDDVFTEQFVFFALVPVVVEGDLFDLGRFRHCAQCQDRGECDTDRDRGDEVECDGDQKCCAHDRGVGAGGARDGDDRGCFDHAHGGGQQYPARAAKGISATRVDAR